MNPLGAKQQAMSIRKIQNIIGNSRHKPTDSNNAIMTMNPITVSDVS